MYDDDQLIIDVEQVGDDVVVRAEGELDSHTEGGLHATLKAVCDAAPSRAVVTADLSAITFFGSAGIALLALSQRRCGERGASFRVMASPAVLHTLRLTGLDRSLDLVPAVPTRP
ncbi:MAG TPA: STAS domain-containing protein [Pseudonocardiaceae bacterium]